MRSPARAALAGALIAALITLPGLSAGTLWDNSETAYGEVAREILLTHDWVVMHLNGAPWFIQPPLYFWLAAAFAKVFGVGTLALRLPSALATVALGAATAAAVARSAGARAGIFASMVLSTSLMQAIIGRLAIMDAMLDLFVGLAVFAFFRTMQTGNGVLLAAGALSCALGFLTKGPVAPVLAVLIAGIYALWNARSEDVRLPAAAWWIGALGVFLLVVLPWPLMLVHSSGSMSLGELIVHYTIGRYTGTIENQGGPFWYYIPVLLLGFFPWIVYLPGAFASAFPSDDFRLQRARGELARLAIVWLVVPLVFFSLAKTKLPNYLALALPGPAILVGLFLDTVAERAKSRGAIVASVFAPLMVALLGVAISIFSRQNHLGGDLAEMTHHLTLMGAVLLVGSIAALVLYVAEQTTLAPFALGASLVIAIDVLALAILPDAERFKPVPRLAHAIEQRRTDSDAVAIQGVPGGNALTFYTRPVVYVLKKFSEPNDPLGVDPHKVICGNNRAWVIASSSPVDADTTYGRHRERIAEDGKAALYLYDGAGCR